MAAPRPLSVLICGAGVAGSSLALMLARSPAFQTKPVITLIERSPSVRITGQAIDIRGPAVDVIRRLGLEPAIKAKHTTETGMAVLDAEGRIVSQFNATGDAEKQSITSEYEILRADLVELLIEGVQQAKRERHNVDIVYGERIESLENRDQGVHVKFRYGKLPDQTYDAVIAADGSSSKTRPMIFGHEEGDASPVKPSGMYIGWFTIPRIPDDDSLYRCCRLPGGLSMHLRPHADPRTVGCYLSIANGEKAPLPELEDVLRRDAAAQKAYLRTRFQGVAWQSERFLAGLDAADDFYFTHWCQVSTPQWAKGRCAIIGDAAHAIMGVGTSLAMAGAYALAGELSKVTSPHNVPEALRSYERIFRPCVVAHDNAPPEVPQSASLPYLLMPFFGGEEKGGWKLPEYGWEAMNTEHMLPVADGKGEGEGSQKVTAA